MLKYVTLIIYIVSIYVDAAEAGHECNVSTMHEWQHKQQQLTSSISLSARRPLILGILLAEDVSLFTTTTAFSTTAVITALHAES